MGTHKAWKAFHRSNDVYITSCITTQIPRWLSGNKSACQCRRHRRHGLNPWVTRQSIRKGLEGFPQKQWYLCSIQLSSQFLGQEFEYLCSSAGIAKGHITQPARYYDFSTTVYQPVINIAYAPSKKCIKFILPNWVKYFCYWITLTLRNVEGRLTNNITHTHTRTHTHKFTV